MFSLIHKVQQYYQEKFPEIQDEPLLDKSTLLRLQGLANSMPTSLLDSHREQAQPLIGESLSIHYGQGLEFEENRLYVQGDDPRFINWRLMARTGNLYSKVFRESRQPQVFIIMDRRSGMHFGTRRQLKVTLAAQLAVFVLYQALHRQYSVSGVVVENTIYRSGVCQTETQLQPLLQSVIAPSVLHAFDSDQPGMLSVLQQVNLQLKPGNIIFILSDFHDLSKDCEPALLNMARLHDVTAIQVIDPAELVLPGDGQLSVMNEKTNEPINLDLQGNDVRNVYQQEKQKLLQDIRDRLRYTGCGFLQASTQQEADEIIRDMIYAR